MLVWAACGILRLRPSPSMGGVHPPLQACLQRSTSSSSTWPATEATDQYVGKDHPLFPPAVFGAVSVLVGHIPITGAFLRYKENGVMVIMTFKPWHLNPTVFQWFCENRFI